MHRTQLMLEQWQYEALKASAEQQRVSLSHMVRDILTRHLRPTGGNYDALSRIEGIASDGTSSARDHDAYLYGKRRRR